MLGKLPRKDAEVVILRVGHLRDCEYELQQHRRLARTRGIGPDLQAKIFEGPDADGLTDRQRALITATDEFVVTRGVSPETWPTLSSHLSKRAADRILHAGRTIRWAGRHHDDAEDAAGLPGLRHRVPRQRYVTPSTTSDSSTGDIGRAHRNAALTSDFCW